MRKFPFLLLLATAGAPALAQSEEGRFGRLRNDSAEPRDSRPQRPPVVQRSERTANPQSAGERLREHYQQRRQEPAAAQLAADGNARFRRGGDGDVRVRRGGDDNVQVLSGGGDRVPLRRDDVGAGRLQRGSAGGTAVLPSTDWAGRERRVGTVRDSTPAASGPATNWRERERRVRTIPETNPVATSPATGEGEALSGRNRRDYRGGDYNRWSHNWRHDRRYDWRHYRSRYASLFRFGRYYDPFGWNYRHWSIGSFLYPSYYGSGFWLSDPWYYRLPPTYGPYRWVRYWNDVLLVNIYTGQVVDRVHGFFW